MREAGISAEALLNNNIWNAKSVCDCESRSRILGIVGALQCGPVSLTLCFVGTRFNRIVWSSEIYNHA